MQLSFKYQDRDIQFEVVYRPRRTMAIRVEPPGRVTAVVPIGAEKAIILKKVQEKAAWIVRNIDRCKNLPRIFESDRVSCGESITYRGKRYLLNIVVDASRTRTRIEIEEGNILMSAPTRDSDRIKKALEAFFRRKAREAIKERIRFYQPSIPKIPNRIFIKEQRSRWGSCSSLGNLNFNWKLILLPPEVFDYVVVHEMCHLVYLNHSREFWSLVASILPEYRASYQWLRQNPQAQIW